MNQAGLRIQQGDRVQIEYTTRSLEGGVIETSQSREPLEFHAGTDSIIRGVSYGVIGMICGESQTLTVAPEHAFGRQRAELIRSAPIDQLPPGTQPGDQLVAVVNNANIDVWVQRIRNKDALVDANHPLAGETLVIDVKVVDHSPVSGHN